MKSFPSHEPQSTSGSADIHFNSTQPDTSIHCKTTDKRLVHHLVCLFTPQLLLLPQRDGQAELTSAVDWIPRWCRCDSNPGMVIHPSSNRAQCTKLCWSRPTRYHYTKSPTNIILWWTSSHMLFCTSCIMLSLRQLLLQYFTHAAMQCIMFWLIKNASIHIRIRRILKVKICIQQMHILTSFITSLITMFI